MAGPRGQTRTSDEPERRCIATGESQPKSGLIRFVVGPDETIVPDLLEKLPGRGIWVAADRDALKKAVEKNLFSRGAKRKVALPDDLIAQVARSVEKRNSGRRREADISAV